VLNRATSKIRTLLYRLVPWSLRGQIALALALIALLSIVGLGVYFDRTMRHTNDQEIASRLEAEARLIGRSLATLLNSGVDASVIQASVVAFGSDTSTRITIIAIDGTVIADSVADPADMDNHLNRPEIAEAFVDGRGVAQRQSGTVSEDFLYVAIRIPDAPQYVSEVAMSMRDINAANAALRERIVLSALIAALVASGAGIYFARRISTSLADLEASVSRMASDELGTEIELPRTRELGALADAFNQMTLRLDESFAENRRARMRWASAFASLSDGLILVNSREEVTSLNPAGARLLQTDLEWAVGQAFVLVARDHELITLLRDSLRRQETRRSVIEFTRGEIIIEATAGPVAGFNEPYAIVTLRDVTELRKLESVRREFVANVSHELRTPIASIKAMVETLEAGAIEDRELTNDFLNRMVGESDRLAALVDDLLDLGRLESGRVTLHVEPLEPGELLRRATERLRPQTERARLELVTSIPDGLPNVLADRGRVEQVVLNLVHNAIKFTPAGGTITVSATQKNQDIVVAVADTGAGIALDEQPRLFERFYKVDRSRRSVGTGLGLAIAKHIVQAHDGSIWVESAPGEGSTFRFTLPIAGDGAPQIDPHMNQR
jgi:two-component system phosphate regulon sensor histidine kinase PhoR